MISARQVYSAYCNERHMQKKDCFLNKTQFGMFIMRIFPHLSTKAHSGNIYLGLCLRKKHIETCTRQTNLDIENDSVKLPLYFEKTIPKCDVIVLDTVSNYIKNDEHVHIKYIISKNGEIVMDVDGTSINPSSYGLATHSNWEMEQLLYIKKQTKYIRLCMGVPLSTVAKRNVNKTVEVTWNHNGSTQRSILFHKCKVILFPLCKNDRCTECNNYFLNVKIAQKQKRKRYEEVDVHDNGIKIRRKNPKKTSKNCSSRFALPLPVEKINQKVAETSLPNLNSIADSSFPVEKITKKLCITILPQGNKLEMEIKADTAQRTETKIPVLQNLQDESYTQLTKYYCGTCRCECVETPIETGKQSIQCDRCNFWFHYSCQQIIGTENFINSTGISWYCDICKDRIASKNGKTLVTS